MSPFGDTEIFPYGNGGDYGIKTDNHEFSHPAKLGVQPMKTVLNWISSNPGTTVIFLVFILMLCGRC